MPSGSPVADFGLAMNRKFKGNDGAMKEDVTFVDITCFGKTAELCSQYLSKGRQALIEGHLKFEQWEDKNGGGKRSKLKVVAERVTFIGGGGKEGGETSKPQKRAEPRFEPDDEGVPF